LFQEDNYGENGPNIRRDDDNDDDGEEEEYTLLYIKLKTHHNRLHNGTAVQNNEQELTLHGFFSPSPPHTLLYCCM